MIHPSHNHVFVRLLGNCERASYLVPDNVKHGRMHCRSLNGCNHLRLLSFATMKSVAPVGILSTYVCGKFPCSRRDTCVHIHGVSV